MGKKSVSYKWVDSYRINLVQGGKNMQCPGCGGETFLPPSQDKHRAGNVYLCNTSGCTAKRLKIVKGEIVKKEAK